MVSNAELATMVRNLDHKLDGLINDIKLTNKAFPTNDLHEPDFDGHRKSHIEMSKAARVMQNYKIEASKKVIGWIAVFLAGIIASGLLTALKRALTTVN